MNKFNSNLDLSFKEFKNQSSCSVCGYGENTSGLHFHHVNPAHKIAEISKFISDRDYYGTISELGKCTILCANCHALYHNSTSVIQKLMAEKFVKVDIDSFLQICKEYGAYESDNDTNPNLDLVKRVIALEQEVKTLKSILQRKQEPKSIKIQTTKTEVIEYLGDIENIVIETYRQTRSLNKTTQAAFGVGKCGAYYIKKIRPILEKHELIN